MKMLFITVLILIGSLCTAQLDRYEFPHYIFTSHTLADHELAGNVATVNYCSPKYIDSFNYDGVIKTATLFFNQKGLLLEVLNYRFGNNQPLKSHYYHYDDNGNLILESSLHSLWQIAYRYNLNNDLIEELFIDNKQDSSKTSYSYSNDKKTISISHHKNGVLKSTRVIELDGKGNMLQSKAYNYNHGVCESETSSTYQYNEQGNLSVATHSPPANSVHRYYYNHNNQLVKEETQVASGISVRLMEYNEQGRIHKISYFEGEGKVPISQALYEYDAQGNWIKKTEIYDSRVTSIKIREISYW